MSKTGFIILFEALEMLKRGLNDLKYMTEVLEKKFVAAESEFESK